MSTILSDHATVKEDYRQKHEGYIERKSNKTNNIDRDTVQAKLNIFLNAKSELESLLSYKKELPEKIWQNKIADVLLLLYPKYIQLGNSFRFKEKGLRKEFDMVLFDAAGGVDILEIKKPLVGQQNVIKRSHYRKNYVPSAELSGAVMQVEKYIYLLNRHSESLEKKLLNKFRAELPSDYVVRISAPMAIVVFGRDNEFDHEQQFDFELIKRKYKSVMDIITYDDLRRRLENITSALQKNIDKINIFTQKVTNKGIRPR